MDLRRRYSNIINDIKNQEGIDGILLSEVLPLLEQNKAFLKINISTGFPGFCQFNMTDNVPQGLELVSLDQVRSHLEDFLDEENDVEFDDQQPIYKFDYIESGEGVFNYFDIEFLDEFFNLFKNKYQIIYIRPKRGTDRYYEDKNDILDFKDYNLIKDKHREVLTIYDLIKDGDDFNETQFKIHATSENHLSVSGGNACIAAYFGGELVIYDSPFGLGAGRGIWKTDSWLRLLSQSKIIGKNNYSSILDYTKQNWL